MNAAGTVETERLRLHREKAERIRNPSPTDGAYLGHRVAAIAITEEIARCRMGQRPLTVLDVGCGVRPYRFLFGANDRYFGIDAGAKAGVAEPDVVGDVRHIPFRDSTFDMALGIHVFEHVREVRQLIREIRRVLKPGGVLLFNAICMVYVHGPPVFLDYWRFTPRGCREALNGFEDVRILESHGWDVFTLFYHINAALDIAPIVRNARRWRQLWSLAGNALLLRRLKHSRTEPDRFPLAFWVSARKPWS